MPSYTQKFHAPVVQIFARVTVSVSSQASAQAAGVGPFRGLFFRTTGSATIIGQNGNELALNDVQPNILLWIEGSFVSLISSTENSLYAVN